MSNGDANFMIQRFEKSQEYYERALKGDPKNGNARIGLAAALGVPGSEIVASASGMCVQEEQRLVFPGQHFEQRNEHDVLENIREIAGVEGVLVVHGTGVGG